jgi:type II secretory pathway component PulC
MAALLFALAALHAAWGVRQASRLSSGVPPKIQVAAAAPAQTGPDLVLIAQRHFFGLPPESFEARQAPPTRANLVLGGTWYVAGGAGAYALVGEVGGSQRPYRPSDRLPGGMELVEIQADRVVLRRDGHTETLHLPRGPAMGAAASPATPTPADLLRRR